MDGRVEAASGPFAGLERERGDLEQLLADLERARRVEARKLAGLVEPGEDLLEAAELVLHPGEGLVLGDAALYQAFHVCAHGFERVGLHQEVLVFATGGRLTICTDGADTETVTTRGARAAASAASFARLSSRR